MYYAMSDIHGNREAWDVIMKKIKLRPGDTLCILGDVIDRGEGGISILKEIMTNPQIKMILGNHEYMMLAAMGFPHDGICTTDDRQLWYMNHGDITMYHFQQESMNAQFEIIKFLRELRLNLIIGSPGSDNNITLCHAGPREYWPKFKDQYKSKAEYSVWCRDALDLMKAKTSYRCVFGHTPTIMLNNSRNSEPLEIFNFENRIFGIDCGAGYPDMGRLACLCIDTGEVIYSE